VLPVETIARLRNFLSTSLTSVFGVYAGVMATAMTGEMGSPVVNELLVPSVLLGASGSSLANEIDTSVSKMIAQRNVDRIC
jgi:hypothetical protein